MRLVPASLFGRTALLILAVLVLSQAGTVAMFRHYNNAHFPVRLADLLFTQIQIVTASLNAIDSDDQPAYIEGLRRDDYLRLLPAQGRPAPGAAVRDPMGQRLETLLSEHLGYPTVLRVEPGRFWIRIRNGYGVYWLMLPRPLREHPLPWQWIAVGALMALLAVSAAFALAWRINRPLRRLTAAASLVGQGAAPPPLKESGVAEISAVSRAFNQMAADLHDLDTDRALLLASVSHDLRTPLARLRLGLEMVSGQIDDGVHDGMVQDVEDIDVVVGQFLAYVRDDGGEKVDADGDLNRIVSAVVERYHRLGAQVTTHLNALPPLPLRPTAMQRLVTNLADNALHHGCGAIEIDTALEDDGVRLRVLDRGPGIPQERLEAMLQPFTRMERSRGGEGGTGLGLAIVARIARLHGGDVRLLNRDGGGLEARVTLPVSA